MSSTNEPIMQTKRNATIHSAIAALISQCSRAESRKAHQLQTESMVLKIRTESLCLVRANMMKAKLAVTPSDRRASFR